MNDFLKVESTGIHALQGSRVAEVPRHPRVPKVRAMYNRRYGFQAIDYRLLTTGYPSPPPLHQPTDCQCQQHHVVNTGKYQPFYKVQRNGGNVGSDPPVPAFNFLFRHQPHARIGCCRCKSVGPRDGTGKVLLQKGERKKNDQIEGSEKAKLKEPLPAI